MQKLEPQEPGSLVWAFAIIEAADRQVFGAISQKLERQIDDLGARELGLFADALPSLRPSLMPNLKITANRLLRALLEAQGGGQKRPLLQDKLEGISTLGAVGSSELLAMGGLQATPGLSPETLPEGKNYGVGAVLCIAEYEVGPFRGRLLHRNSAMAGPQLLEAMHLPGAVDRAACAEFKALCELAALLPDTDLTGSVRMSISEPPCLSCVSAMLQFSRRFSNIELTLMIDSTLLRFAEVHQRLDGSPSDYLCEPENQTE